MRLPRNVRGLMRTPVSDKRPYQAPFTESERAVIESALIYGLMALDGDKSLDLRTCKETDINLKLENILNRMLESASIPGFTKALFQTVIRGAELLNHDGTLPEKRPDLTFRTVRALPGLMYPEQCVLIVECKIVDKLHPMSRYCSEGVARFVNGTYAWAVSEAIMLGYARDDYNLPTQLEKHLRKFGTRYDLVGRLAKRSTGSLDRDLYISTHRRDSVNGLPKGAKGCIELHHLWVSIA